MTRRTGERRHAAPPPASQSAARAPRLRGGAWPWPGVALLCAALLAQVSHAQAPAPSLPLPAGNARIVGRVLHTESGAPARGIEVVLYALRESGAPGIARTSSNDDGRFEFAQISNDPAISYLLGARYRDLPYPGERVVFAPGAQVAEAVIRVAELTPSPKALRSTGVSLRVRREARGLRVEHSVRTHNDGARTYYRGAAARARDAAFELTLPRRAHAFEMPLGAEPEGLLREGRRLSYFGPIHPGAHELSFQYLLPGASAEDGAEHFFLHASAPPGTPVEVLLPRGLGAVDAPRMTRATQDARNAQDAESEERWVSSAGGAFDIALTLPPARRDPFAVRVRDARAVLSADDVALEVSENYTLEVTGDAMQLADADSPFLLVTLPPGARALHFGSDAPGVTLEAQRPALPATADAPAVPLSEAERAQSWLAAVGSAAPGRFQVGVRYQLAVDDARRAHFARRFATRLPAFSIFLADSGDLAPASTRLHRRRPLREPGRNYLHLEAFEVARGEVIELAIGRRARAGAARGPFALGAAALLALGAVLFLAAPLRAGDGVAAHEQSESEGARERAALVAAIHDLDHDFETGKLSAPDHAELRSELRARAIEALRQEREQSARREAAQARAPRGAAEQTRSAAAHEPAKSGAAARTDVNPTGAAPNSEAAGAGAASATQCPQCLAAAAPAHRFCPECGARLQPEAPA